jgi:hypothetical protein
VHGVLGHPLHTARHGLVPRREHLVATRVEHRHDQPRRVAQGVRDEIEAGHADHGDAQGLGHHLGRRHADAQPGEESRADAHGDGREVTEVDSALAAQVVDGGRELLGMTAPARELHGAEHRATLADGHRHLRRRRVEREDQHVVT